MQQQHGYKPVRWHDHSLNNWVINRRKFLINKAREVNCIDWVFIMKAWLFKDLAERCGCLWWIFKLSKPLTKTLIITLGCLQMQQALATWPWSRSIRWSKIPKIFKGFKIRASLSVLLFPQLWDQLRRTSRTLSRTWRTPWCLQTSTGKPRYYYYKYGLHTQIQNLDF